MTTQCSARESPVWLLLNMICVLSRKRRMEQEMQQFRARHPDVTLMDLQMPEMNGLDAMITIQGEFPDASRIIVLTTWSNGNVPVLRALKAGAEGYLLKTSLIKTGKKYRSERSMQEKPLRPRSHSS